MAKVKQSDVAFLMMKDWREQLSLLSDEQRGKLLTAIYDYQCDGMEFDTDDGLLKMLWASVRQTFERNNEKYEEMCKNNSLKAKKRWAKNDAGGCSGIFLDAKDADIDRDKDRDTDSDTDNESELERVTDSEREGDKDVLPLLRYAKKWVDDLLANPAYNCPEMQRRYDSFPCTKAEYGALGDLMDEKHLHRYLNKVCAYDVSSVVDTVLRWAAEDSNLKTERLTHDDEVGIYTADGT